MYEDEGNQYSDEPNGCFLIAACLLSGVILIVGAFALLFSYWAKHGLAF
ncbi:MAG: hypothetical protein ACRBCK_09920 [Alphaproteobacteria bacterium]